MAHDEPEETRAADLLSKRIDDALDYLRKEFNVTISVAVGVLMCKSHELMHEADEEEDEPE